MNLLDLLIVVVAVAAASGGFGVGFLTNAGSWVGGGLGLFLGAKLAPAVLGLFPGGGALLRLVVAAVVFVTVASLPAALGQGLGRRVHWFLPAGGARTADRVAGLAAGLIGVAVLVWLLGPVLSQVPGAVARQARGSLLARTIAEAAPPPPDAIAELQQLVTATEFPEVFEELRRSPAAGPVPPSVGLAGDVRSRVTAATVRIEGQACGQTLTGSGFAAGPSTVVTNAHVVAGIARPRVFTADNRRLTGQVVLFDDNRDLALVQVPGLDLPPLPLGSAAASEEGAVFGHPGGQQSVAVSPARVEREMPALGRDIYGEDLVRRQVLVLASRLQPGDSGGPLVDRTGQVMGVAFAVAPDRQGTAYALSDDELKTVLAAPRNATATGGCIR